MFSLQQMSTLLAAASSGVRCRHAWLSGDRGMLGVLKARGRRKDLKHGGVVGKVRQTGMSRRRDSYTSEPLADAPPFERAPPSLGTAARKRVFRKSVVHRCLD